MALRDKVASKQRGIARIVPRPVKGEDPDAVEEQHGDRDQPGGSQEPAPSPVCHRKPMIAAAFTAPSVSMARMLAIDGLACPACRGDLRAVGETQLSCQRCQATYPLFEGIPSFIPAPASGGPAAYQLTVVIPALNEAGNLDQLLPALQAELA